MEPLPQHIGRPAPTYTSGPTLNEIAQRWLALRGSYASMDAGLADFLERDVARLLQIARAAYAMQAANNAEKYRQATAQLMSALRAP